MNNTMAEKQDLSFRYPPSDTLIKNNVGGG